jgi:hypothetical protein
MPNGAPLVEIINEELDKHARLLLETGMALAGIDGPYDSEYSARGRDLLHNPDSEEYGDEENEVDVSVGHTSAETQRVLDRNSND